MKKDPKGGLKLKERGNRSETQRNWGVLKCCEQIPEWAQMGIGSFGAWDSLGETPGSCNRNDGLNSNMM